MGLWERLQRHGHVGGGGNNRPASGFSSSRYYARNSTSAGSFLAPPPSVAGAPVDTKRPYADIGKSSINLFGRPVMPKSPELREMPAAFQGGEDQGGLLGAAARAIGELGKLPVASAIPFIGTGFTGYRLAQQQFAKNAIRGNEEDYRKWAQQADDAGESNWMTNTRLMTMYARDRALESGQLSRLQAAQVMAPVDENLGGMFQYMLQAISIPQQYVQRGIGGIGGDERLRDIQDKSNEELENNPELIRIRDEVKSGKLARDAALDELTIAGYGVTDPIGQSKPIQAIRSIGDNTPLDVPFDIIANTVAAGASLGLEVFTDPANLASLGAASALKITTKGAVKALGRTLVRAGDDAVEDAVAKGVLKSAEGEAADLIKDRATYAERQRLGEFLPEGVPNTDMNLIRYGLAAKDPAVRAGMEAVGAISRPFVANQHVLGWMQKVENVLDPLTLFGRDKMARFANKSVAMRAIDGGTNSLGKHNIAPVMKLLERAGVNPERFSGDLGTAFANVMSQVGGEAVAHHHVRLSIGIEDATDPTALTDLGRDMLQRHGHDVESLMRHKMDKVKALPRQAAGESVESALVRERKFVANLLTKMYGLSDEVAMSVTARMGEGQLGVVRFMQYGHMADGLLNARKLSKAEGAAMGLSPEFIERIIFLGPTQLTKAKALALREAISTKDIGAIRQAIGQYDVLEWNLSQALSDDELIKRLGDLLDGMQENLPEAIDPASLTPSMRAFQEKFGDSMELGLRGENIFQTGQDQAGRITSVDPFMDYVRGADVDIVDIKPDSIVQQNVARLLNKVSGSQIVIEQNRRFAQQMAEHGDLTREQSDQLMHLIRQQASIHEVSSSRGLTHAQLDVAVKAVVLPDTLKNKLTTRQVQRALFFAHEGSLGRVGLTQKFTGRLKSFEVNRGGTNRLGTLAERYYPLVRFKWNAYFQMQEGIETPVLLLARGMISPGQFAGPLGGVRAGLGEAIRAPSGERRAAFRQGRRAEVERAKDIDYQTAVMMDAFAADSRYAAEMVEYSDVVRYGSAAASRAASTSEGRALTSLLNDQGVARIKTRGQLIAFRKNYGDNMARMLKRESPVMWDVMRVRYGRLSPDGIVDDGEVGVRWFNDLLLRNDPDSAFSAVQAHNNPADFFRPSFLGRRTRWSDKVVMQGLSGEMVDTGTTFAQLRARYRDPADTVITPRWMEERLRALGADEWYIERTKWRMDYETEQEFEAALTEIAGSDEAASIMEHHRIIAKAEELPLIESLADKYASSPKTLDENGTWKPTTLFQMGVDSFEARGMKVVAREHEAVVVGGHMARIGAVNMPDIGLPPAMAQLSWENHVLAQHTELVPVSLLKDIQPGNELRLTPKELDKLARDIKSGGIREPIQLTYYHGDRTVNVGEGNHRIAAVLQLARERPKAALDIPVTVFRYEGVGGGTPIRGAKADEFGYVPGNLRPSDIGIGDVESAAIRRHDAALRRDTAVKDLTEGQKKGRTYQQARARRAADPLLGTPGLIVGVEDGRLVARNADGAVTHRLGGKKTVEEWVEELEANMTYDELKEHADWYSEMRRMFMALNDNQQEQATHLLMAFGITQLNTSPIDGMKYMWRVVEAIESGKGLPADALELQKLAGLNGEALKHLMEKGYLSEEGMGQKLIDFVDSLLGMDGRTVPVRGPNGKWTAVAGDIWAKRDVGYIDAKMLDHLRHAYGEQYDVRKVTTPSGRKAKKSGEPSVDVTFRFTDRKTGQTFTIDKTQVGGNPNELEYDAIVEFYNNAADHLNEIGFLGRKDWVAAEAQALGWFKGKKAFGDDTGDPLAAHFDSVYTTNIAQVEVAPRAGVPMHVLYPETAVHTSDAIAGRTAHEFNDESDRLVGTRTISTFKSLRMVDGRTGSATNFAVAGSPDGVRKKLAVLGATSGQGRVRATRVTTAKPTKKNGVRHMVQMQFPSTISPDEMHAAHRALAEDAPDFFGDADLDQLADGTWVIRVVANADETPTAFKARMNDVRLRELHSSVHAGNGYARGRYVNPDEPMKPGAREQKIRDTGQRRIDQSLADPKPHQWKSDVEVEQLADDLWQSVQPEKDGGWGGLSVDAHGGKQPKPAGEAKGGGPYSTGIGETVSLPLDVSEQEFKAAVHAFVAANRDLLERPRAGIGVFRDIDPTHNRIDLDVNLIVDTHDEVEGVQLVLGRDGGAYDFTTGDSVYSPVFDPEWSNEVTRGYADVIELENDWTANPNGEGYLQHLEDLPDVRRELEREGVQWGRMVYEDAYQSLAARETAAHRAGRANSGVAGFDLDDPAGYLQRSPRGTRATRLAAAESARGRRLFQRTGTGKPRGAITDAGAALSTSGKKPRRAQIHVSPKRKTEDTLAHEYAHDYINRYLQPSAIRRAKAIYAGREGTPPVIDAKSRNATLTVDEQEWLADQLIEYMRQGGDAMAHPALVPLAEHYKKSLKDRKVRVEADTTAFDADVARHQAETAAYEGRRVAHEAERARQLAGEGGPTYEPIPAGAQIVPEGPTAGELWDELMAGEGDWRRRGIKPGETQSVGSVLMSDEDYGRFMARYKPFITSEPPLRPGGAPRDTFTLPAERPPTPPPSRRYVTAEGQRVTQYPTELGEHATATAQRNAVRATHKKWDQSGTKNGAAMERDLNRLEEQDIDVSEEQGLLEEYNDMERGDFDSREEYQDARAEVWEQLLETLDVKATHYMEDLGLDETAIPVAAVDIGEFAEAPPAPPMPKPKATTKKLELHPEVKDLFDTIDKTPAPKNAYSYDVDEQAALNWMYAAHRRADRVSKDLVHFKTDRSWLERSLNHPYFGLYPLSYMWGKVLPEMVEFLLFRPFGFKTPLIAADLVNTMYQHTMNAIENDPELAAFMAENEDAFRAISMLVPGVPWDLPVNSPLWLRRYVEGVATNLQDDIDGKKPEDYGAWETFVTDLDWGKTAEDVFKYSAGPVMAAKTFAEYPGLAAKVVGGMQLAPEEEEAANLMTQQQLQQQQQREMSASMSRPQQQQQPQGFTAEPELEEGTIEELQATLGGSYEDVLAAISE